MIPLPRPSSVSKSASPRALAWSAQLVVFLGSGVAAWMLRFEFKVPPGALAALGWSLIAWLLAKSAVFALLHLDRGWWRYASVPDVVRIGLGNVAGSALAAGALVAFSPVQIPRSIYLIDLLLCAHGTAALRLAARIVRDHALVVSRSSGPRVFLYGAGHAGFMLLKEIQTNPRLDYEVAGFIDDDLRKKGMFVCRVPVLGSGADLPVLAAKRDVEEVLIAIPSATGQQMVEMFNHCYSAGLRCRTMPGMAEIIEEADLAPQIRDVDVEDLLGRTPVRLDQDIIHGKLSGKTILVTGAAGSIGSEICRQVARFQPSAIVGFDISETGLFFIEREIRELFPAIPFHAEIGSVQNRSRLAEAFERYRPAAVYHAAAYKHVPLMEDHLVEAVANNILGTFNVADAAATYGVADFVMISSDKAVRPVNIMGLTKRVAELVVRGMQNGGTRFTSVRFGNVLGSNGSVVPIFKQQIAAGGPVTVTDPEMTRYFMTIPEAVQLVLQASTMGHGGEIFVLDMGAPVKIVDLARNLILLSGLRIDEDIEIKFNGIRPGEKLYEELSAYNENTAPTFHEKIKVFLPAEEDTIAVAPCIATLRELCQERDSRAIFMELKDLVAEYNPSAHILRQLLSEPGKSLAVVAGR